MSARKPIIGLCGGIGAGKSRVAAEFERLGCVVVDSDRLSHEVLRRPEVLATLRTWWGAGVADERGEPDRRFIGRIVFGDPEQKRRLESLLYPLIAAERAAIIRATEKNPAVKAIILDSPLLFESNLDRLCDSVVFVEASPSRRSQRLKRTRNWDEHELRQRERWHQPLDEKRAQADFVLDNDGEESALRPQVEKILDTIVSGFAAEAEAKGG